MDDKPQLGDRIKDQITGFTGIALGYTDWLSNCRRWIIQPETLHDGKRIEAESFDETTILVLARGVVTSQNETAPQPPKPTTRKTGGPMPTPRR